jgi:hypothetical protein
VDHVLPLHDIDLNSSEGRALATNPAWLRAAHLGCNSKRGNRTSAVKRRKPEVFNLNQIARQQAAERRSERW